MAIAKTAGSLLDLLSKATEEDLVEIRKQIGEAQKHLDSLHAIEKLLVIKVHGKPEKQKRGARLAGKQEALASSAKGETTRKYRVKAAEYLIHAGTPVKRTTLLEACGIPSGSSTGVFDHAWFSITDQGIGLTPEGRKMTG